MKDTEGSCYIEPGTFNPIHQEFIFLRRSELAGDNYREYREQARSYR